MEKIIALFGFTIAFFSSTTLSFEQIVQSQNIKTESSILNAGTVDENSISVSSGLRNNIEVLEPLLTVLPTFQHKTLLGSLVEAVNTDDKITMPSSVTELINTTPSVSQNGQGGHFQNFSIRGVSRHRIKTLVNGIRIESDRRAGVSASFIDPLLIGDALVWRNPASTHFGSGALGGAVEIEPYHFSSLNMMAGYSSLGNEHYQVLGFGDEHYSIGLARREAANSNGADGEELNTHFTQYSAVFSAQNEWQGLTFNLLALPALAIDVGKSNIDYPQRITNYPKEKHLLFKLGVDSESGWSSEFYIHPNELETHVHKIKKSISKVSNTAFNFGGNWQFEQSVDNLASTIGIDYFGRRSINISEKKIKLNTGQSTRSQSLRDGEENEFGFFGTFNWQWYKADIKGGMRFSYFNQTQGHASVENDTAWSGFFGITYPFENGLNVSANFATGYRFPSLSERFFTGTTGRGSVIGNPGLKTEQSMNFDLGVKWTGTRLSVGGNVFYLKVSDYIERIEISDNVLSYVNLNNGRIIGAEVDTSYSINEQLNFTWSGHFLEGRDDKGNALADIPSHRFLFGLEYKTEQWESLLQLEMRAEKNDQGSSEKNINSAQLLSAAIRYRPHRNLLLSITGSNLLNEKYFNSADRKSTFAQQRSIGFNASWKM